MRWIVFSLWCVSQAVSAASHHPQDFLKSIAGSKTEGKQLVEHYCAMCHAEKPMIQIGAPRIQNEADWTQRVTQGLDALFQHTEEGLGAMPARGGCFECTDEQLWLAIFELLPPDLSKKFKTNK